MKLDRKNVRIILLIITFAVVLYTAAQNLAAIYGAVATVWNVFGVVITGLAMAFVLNVPLKLFENRVFYGMSEDRRPYVRKMRRPVSLVCALVVTLGTPVSKLPEAFRVFGYGDFCGMERGVSMAIVVLLLALPLLYKMRWGHYIMTLGSNPLALRRSGVRLGPWRISAFALMGFLSALAGMIITARLNSAEPNAGLNMEMDAITAVIMGGTPLHGGQGALIGTTVAVLLLSSIRNGLTLLRISSYYQQLITGVILLCAVITAELRQRRQRV